MKKQILMVAAVALALGGCSKTETTEVAQGRAIGFDAFVGKSTKAVTEVTDNNLTEFYVFGNYQNEQSWVDVFDNTQVTETTVGASSEWTPAQTAYWLDGKIYKFGAYANGNGGKLESGVSFDPETETLKFENYDVTAEGTGDLIAAVPAFVTPKQPVALTFNHMLSQVKFTFTNEDADTYTMKISDIKIESAVTTCTGTYTNNGGASWNDGTPNGTYDFGTLDNIAGTTGTTDLLVIPQNNANLYVTFTATFTDDSDSETPIAEGNFKASLKYTANGTGTDNLWTPGYKYNYTATINASTIDDTLEENIIKFEVTAVEGWKDATEQKPTLDKQE